MRRDISEKLEQKNFKMQIVNEVICLSPEDRSKKINEISEREHCIPYSTKKRIRRATIYSWLKQHQEDKSAGWALIRKKRSDADSFRKLTLIQKKCILRWRHENHRRTCKEIIEELIANNVATIEDVPSISLVARYLKKFSMDRHSLAKKTPKSKIRTPFQADYPNQIWQIDTKGNDLKISSVSDSKVFEDVMPIVILDDYSRYIVAVLYIYKSEETEAMVMAVLMDAIEKYGVCETLYTDRGGPYMGNAMKKALNILGCKVIRTAPRDASAKGKCEKIMPMYTEKLDLELRAKGQEATLNLKTVNEYAKAITYKYHHEVHSATSETPYDRYLRYNGKFRRFVSSDLLLLTFLTVKKSKVSKDNLIHINKRKYIMPLIGYAGKFVDVRCLLLNSDMVYVWSQDEFLGVAEEFDVNNDFLKKHQFITGARKKDTIEIPDKSDVPEFQALERKLQNYRSFQENKASINEEIKCLQKQRADVKAELTLSSSTSDHRVSNISSNDKGEINSQVNQSAVEFTADKFIHLLSTLFRRVLSARERFSVHRIFMQYGPFEEKIVRKVVGSLLGESHPTSDIEGYLDAIRIEFIKKGKESS